MKASAWEFRHRSLVLTAVFVAAFALSSAVPDPAAAAVARWIAGSPPPRWALRLVFGAGALVLAVAAWLRTWGTAYLGASVVYDSRVRLESLVADGPYRHVRNPLYLGTLLLGVGLGVLASVAGWALLVGGLGLVLHRLVAREEALLLESHGEAFRRYREAVPKLLPSLRPRVPSSGARPDWKAGWLYEAPMWLFAAAPGAVAVTLSGGPARVLVAAALVLLILMGRRSRSRKQAGGL